MAEVSAQAPTPVVMPGQLQADPSPRALETIYREIKMLEDKMLLRFDTMQATFHAAEKAIVLLQDFANRSPTTEQVNNDLEALKELTTVQLAGLKELINAIFEGNKAALGAALLTQKESSDKIERNFVEQFKNISSTITILTKTFEDKIADFKDRYNISESTRTGQGKGMTTLWGIVLGVGSLIIIAVTVANFIISMGRTS